MSATVQYGVEIVGTDLETTLEDPVKMERYLGKLLKATAKEIYRKVGEKLDAADFKNSKGALRQALMWDSGDTWAAVYIEDAIAPYGRWQEIGVRPHTMRYLLKATSAIPVPVGNVTLFRWATEKWMGRPHQLVDPVSGLVMMTKGWMHPGYEGHHFMRDGTLEAVEIADQRTEHFVFRVFTMGDDAPEEL